MLVSVSRQIGRIVPGLLFTCIICYFLYHAFSGENGFSAMIQLEKKVEEVETRLAAVKAEQSVYERRAQKLYSKSVDIDLLDEEARKQLGVASKDEIIRYIPAGE